MELRTVIEQGEEEKWNHRNALLAKERLVESISKTSNCWTEKNQEVKVNGFITDAEQAEVITKVTNK